MCRRECRLGLGCRRRQRSRCRGDHLEGTLLRTLFILISSSLFLSYSIFLKLTMHMLKNSRVYFRG